MAGPMIGYARVSSTGQDYATQLKKLKAAGCTKIFEEKKSGLDKDRPELKRCLEYVREGDVLVITKLDRLARSAVHLHKIVEELEEKRVGFKVLDDSGVDTTTRSGRLLFGILASIAEFENALRKERQMEGIARAKAEGRMGGRPKQITDDVVAHMRDLQNQGLSIRKIATEVGFSKSAVQKVLPPRTDAAGPESAPR